MDSDLGSRFLELVSWILNQMDGFGSWRNGLWKLGHGPLVLDLGTWVLGPGSGV